MDLLHAWWADAVDRFLLVYETRTLMTWVWSFAPILFCLEIPRYYLPLIGLYVAERMGLPKVDQVRRRALLARKPLVSVIIAGRNEGETIEACIKSLLNQGWPNLEILVVDDASDDNMFEVADRYARRGQIRLIRNSATRGRLGKPSAFNLGARLANGEFIIAVDADTTYDLNMIEHMIEPFADPKVGVVAGNVHVRNTHANLLTRMETIEYALAIDLHKRWSNLWHCTLQGSGAISAFRRSGIAEVQGWTQELAEDTDISLRFVKAGYRIEFAPQAIAITEVPTKIKQLARQRARWDRGGLRAFYKKHKRLMRPSVAGWSFATEMWSEFFFAVLATVAYPIYLAIYAFIDPWALLLVWLVSSVFYVLLSVSSVWFIAKICQRIAHPEKLIAAAAVLPLLKGFLRWVRFKATVMEVLRLRYEDTFLPQSAWAHAPRW